MSARKVPNLSQIMLNDCNSMIWDQSFIKYKGHYSIFSHQIHPFLSISNLSLLQVCIFNAKIIPFNLFKRKNFTQTWDDVDNPVRNSNGLVERFCIANHFIHHSPGFIFMGRCQTKLFHLKNNFQKVWLKLYHQNWRSPYQKHWRFLCNIPLSTKS